MSGGRGPQTGTAPTRHHAVIAGTGRAGTSFLVRYLEKCGLDVGNPDRAFDDRARAGLEHHLINDEVPYVVKDPWLFAYCDDVDTDVIAIDALIVPIRELMASATSRVLQERIAMVERGFGEWPTIDVNGMVIGGALYSLDPVDEARILAVGFHRLIHWATVKQIPLYLLEFPRAVTDRDYLIKNLWPWLSVHCNRSQAESAFGSVADPELVRVEGTEGGVTTYGPYDSSTLDRDAMAILVKERDSQLAGMEGELHEVSRALTRTEHDLAEARASTAKVELQLEETQVRLGNVQSQLQLSNGQLRQRNAELAEMQSRLGARSAEVQAIRGTLSWRMTRPLRGLKRATRRRGHS